MIAGLGNIYVSEALFRSHLHPAAMGSDARDQNGAARRPAPIVSPTSFATCSTRRWIAGGSTLRDHAQVDGSLGYFQHRFQVYDREGEACVTPACAGVIKRLVQNGRSTFYCPVCQRRR